MKRLWIYGCGLALLSMFGCGGGKATTGTGKIRVGIIVSTTGNYGALGPERIQGATLAFDQINASGGLLGGQQLEALIRDDATEPTNARHIAEDLVHSSGVKAILGASASGSTLAASDVTIPNQVVQISGSSTSPAITGVSDNGFLNRTCASDTLQGRLLAERARGKGFDRVAIIHNINNAYSEGMAQSFTTAFTALGGQVTIRKALQPGKPSYVPELNEVYATNPQAIVLPTYTGEAVQVIKDYVSSFSGKGTFWFFSDSLSENAFPTLVGPQNFTFQHEGTAPSPEVGEPYDNFVSAYVARFGATPTSTSYASNFYDAAYLLALAIEAAGVVDGPAIRDHLRSVSAPPGTPYLAKDFRAAVNAIHQGQDINYNGASGDVDLDESGEPTVAPYSIWQVQNGVITVVQSGVLPTPLPLGP